MELSFIPSATQVVVTKQFRNVCPLRLGIDLMQNQGYSSGFQSLGPQDYKFPSSSSQGPFSPWVTGKEDKNKIGSRGSINLPRVGITPT